MQGLPRTASQGGGGAEEQGGLARAADRADAPGGVDALVARVRADVVVQRGDDPVRVWTIRGRGDEVSIVFAGCAQVGAGATRAVAAGDLPGAAQTAGGGPDAATAD